MSRSLYTQQHKEFNEPLWTCYTYKLNDVDSDNKIRTKHALRCRGIRTRGFHCEKLQLRFFVDVVSEYVVCSDCRRYRCSNRF